MSKRINELIKKTIDECDFLDQIGEDTHLYNGEVADIIRNKYSDMLFHILFEFATKEEIQTYFDDEIDKMKDYYKLKLLRK